MMDTGGSDFLDFEPSQTKTRLDKRMGEEMVMRKHNRQNKEEPSAVADTIVAPDSPMNPEKIYWDEETKVYVHASGMHFDPGPSMNTFYTMIDHSGEQPRTLCYIQNAGDFILATKGKFGKNNKILMEDETWDRNIISNVKSSKYKQGLLKMFKDKFKEDKIFP